MQEFSKVFLKLDKKLHLLLFFKKIHFEIYIKAILKNEIILPIYYTYHHIIL
jgi:hypothetical protein